MGRMNGRTRGMTDRRPISVANHGSNFMIGPASVKTDNVPEERIFYTPEITQSGGASQWRVCYQRGLPCLVYLLDNILPSWPGQS